MAILRMILASPTEVSLKEEVVWEVIRVCLIGEKSGKEAGMFHVYLNETNFSMFTRILPFSPRFFLHDTALKKMPVPFTVMV